MRTTSITVLAAALLLSACQQAAQPLSPADETAIRATLDSFTVAVNAGSADRMTAVYASDAAIHPSGMPAAVGTEAIRKLWTDMTGMMRVTTFTSVTTKVAGQGDVAYVTGTYHLESTSADSAHTPMPAADGKFVEVLWRQTDKSWKVVADNWNENSMPAAPAAPAPATPRR